jgi:hypothetical protein
MVKEEQKARMGERGECRDVPDYPGRRPVARAALPRNRNRIPASHATAVSLFPLLPGKSIADHREGFAFM